MNTLLLVTALLAATSYVKCEIDSNELVENLRVKYLKNYIKERESFGNITARFEALCPGKGPQFEDALVKIKQCGDEIDEYSETACSIMKNHFLKCSKPITKLVEQCLPEESREIPSFIFKSMVASGDYLCKTDGEHIFELANSCIYQSSYRTARCERKLRTKLQQYKRSPPTKNDICEFATSFKPCIQSHLLHACGNEITKEAFLGLFDAATSPCSETTDNNELVNSEVELLS